MTNTNNIAGFQTVTAEKLNADILALDDNMVKMQPAIEDMEDDFMFMCGMTEEEASEAVSNVLDYDSIY